MMPDAECVIRDARLEDAAAVAGLVTQLGYETTPADMTMRLSRIFSDPQCRTLVATKSERVVGVVGVSLAHYYERNGCYARILVLSVAQGERASGVGSKLLSAAEDWARGSAAVSVIVNSATHREEAHAFYQQRGYRATGLRFVKTL